MGRLVKGSVLSMNKLEKQLNELAKEYAEKHSVSLSTAKAVIFEAGKKVLHEGKE